jgi:hypothetical protein
VNVISPADALTSAATWDRAASTASRASQPRVLPVAALPNRSVKTRQHRGQHARIDGVVAW